MTNKPNNQSEHEVDIKYVPFNSFLGKPLELKTGNAYYIEDINKAVKQYDKEIFKVIKELKLQIQALQSKAEGYDLEDNDILSKRAELLNDGKSRTEQEFAIDLVRWAIQSLTPTPSKAVGYSLEELLKWVDFQMSLFPNKHEQNDYYNAMLDVKTKIQSLAPTPIQTKGMEVEFAEWIKDNKWQSFLLDSWIKYDGNGNTVGIEKTTSSLFQLFLTTNTKVVICKQ